MVFCGRFQRDAVEGEGGVVFLVSQNGKILKYVPEELKKNKHICLAAVYNDVNALKYIYNDIPSDLISLEFEGKHFSLSTQKVVTVHRKASTTLFTLCMKNCTKSVYGFLEEIREEILFHVGSFDSRYIKRN